MRGSGAIAPPCRPRCSRRSANPLEAGAAPWSRKVEAGVAQQPTTLGLRRPDGSLSWALVSVAPASRTPDGAALLTFIDVTSTKEASDALSDADRTLRRTISSVTNPAGGSWRAPSTWRASG